MSNSSKYIKFDYIKKDNNNRQRRSMPGNVGNISSKDKQSFDKMFSTFNKVFKYIGKYKNTLILGLFLATLSSVLMMIGPNLIGKMTDLIQEGIYSNLNFDEICKIGIMLIVIYLISALCSFSQQYSMASATAKVCMKFRSDFIEKLNKLPISYFSTHIQGDILSRITNDIQSLRQGISRSLPGIIKAIAQLATCIIMMFITE